MVDHSEKWKYDESFLWGNTFPQCSSLKQSPINIDTEELKECRSLCNIKTRIKPSTCFVEYQNNTITIKYSSGSYTEYQQTLYELKEISIHTPSLHKIDGQSFPLEICMVHKLSESSSAVSGIMLCSLFQSGSHHGKPDQFISQIINSIPSVENEYQTEINVSKDWSANWLIPESSGYFSYEGSLPYPPCQEGYNVIVYEKIGSIGKTHIDIFKKYLVNNSRPVRDLGSRSIFYTPFLKNVESEKKVYVSKNKYLKCYPERALKDTVKTEPSSTKPKSKTINGLSPTTLNTINNIFLSIILLLVIINALYFTKYLFRHFYVQKMLRMFAGSENIKNESINMWKNCQGEIITETQREIAAQLAESGGAANNVTGAMSNTTGNPTNIGRGLRGSSSIPGMGEGGMGSSSIPRND